MDDHPRVINRPDSPVRRRKSVWPSRIRLGLILVVLALALGIGAWLLTPSGQRPAGGAGRFAANGPTPVGVAQVTRGDMPIVRQALGTVTPVATVTVMTQISGTIVAIPFTEGQDVKQGDPLVQIDPRPYDVALQQARGTLLHDQALLDNARVDLARYRTLLAQDSIAEQTMATQQALVRQYEGTVATDKGQVAGAELNLAYCHIVSPIFGRAGLRQVDIGNYVTPSSPSTGLVVLTQTKPITVVFTLPEDDVQAVTERMHSGAKLPVIAYDRNRTHKLAEGTLSAIDSQIDVTTGTVKLKAIFANDDERLFPDQFVNIDLQLDTLRNTDLAPQSAIQNGAPGAYVYVVDPATSTVKVQPVKTGPGNADLVSVASGLQPGQSVVIDGTDRLKSGDKVVVSDGKTAGSSGSGTGASTPAASPSGQHRHRRDETAPPSSGDSAPAAPKQ